MTTALTDINSKGSFVRPESGFREIIDKDHPIYKPAYGRYHLYISLACPWANRCYTTLKLKGLDSCIGVSIVHPTWQKTKPNDPDDNHLGWVFNTSELSSPTNMGKFSVPLCTLDPINGAQTIRALYEMSNDVKKKYSVPVLWDKETKTIVNNESSEILRMFTKVFDEWAGGPYAHLDLYPENLRKDIDEANAWIYPGINDGVYRCGFAKTQIAYDEAIDNLAASLERLEDVLSKHRYVVGDTLTEADIRLFMTLVRYDEVYVVYFKCNVYRLIDLPNVRNYCRDIYQTYHIADTISMEHIKTHYYT
jgi:putative glutathione S-transferase